MAVFNNTADGIMSVFTKTVDKLLKLEAKKGDEVAELDLEIMALQGRQSEASAEGAKAGKYAENIKTIMEG